MPAATAAANESRIRSLKRRVSQALRLTGAAPSAGDRDSTSERRSRRWRRGRRRGSGTEQSGASSSSGVVGKSSSSSSSNAAAAGSAAVGGGRQHVGGRPHPVVRANTAFAHNGSSSPSATTAPGGGGSFFHLSNGDKPATGTSSSPSVVAAAKGPVSPVDVIVDVGGPSVSTAAAATQTGGACPSPASAASSPSKLHYHRHSHNGASVMTRCATLDCTSQVFRIRMSIYKVKLIRSIIILQVDRKKVSLRRRQLKAQLGRDGNGRRMRAEVRAPAFNYTQVIFPLLLRIVQQCINFAVFL